MIDAMVTEMAETLKKEIRQVKDVMDSGVHQPGTAEYAVLSTKMREVTRFAGFLHAISGDVPALKAVSEFRPFVLKFAGLMELRLRANDHKNGRPVPLEFLKKKLWAEFDSLLTKADLEDGSHVEEEAADVANIAAMFCSRVGLIPGVEKKWGDDGV